MVSTIHGILTALLLLAFIAIVVWAYSSRRSEKFDRAARSVLNDDPQDGLSGARKDG